MFCAVVDAAEDYANGDLPGAAGELAGGVAAPVVGAVTDNIATVLTGWVSNGAAVLLGKLAGFLIDATTTPHLEAEWFASHYRAMVGLAGLLILPFLLSSILGAVVHQDLARLGRTVFGYLPAAGILTAGAVTLVVGGLELTDWAAGWMSEGTDAGQFLTATGVALKAVGLIPGGAFLEFGLGLLLVVGAAAVWLELLIRSAAIYVAVLFLPLALAGMVWPATSHWIRRLTHLLIAVILSKFVIVAILSLAASGLAAVGPGGGDGGGLGSAFAGGALLVLAAFSPLALLRMVPIVEANLAASVGAGRGASRVSQTAAGKVSGGRSLIDDAQAWNLRNKTTPPPATWRSFQTKPTTSPPATATAATGAATGGAAAAAGAGLKVAGAAGRHASGVANGVGSLPDGASTSSAGGRGNGGNGGGSSGPKPAAGSGSPGSWWPSPGGELSPKPKGDNGNGAEGPTDGQR